MATETPVVDSPAQDRTMTDAPVADAEGQDQTVDAGADQVDDNPFPVKIKFPNGADLEILISPLEQIHEIRQSIIENPIAVQYSCFHLEHKGKRINDFVQVSDVEALAADSILDVVEDPYTEKEARIHIIRIRELVGAAGDRTDTVQGILSGLSLYDDVLGAPSGPGQEAEAKKAAEKDIGEYDFEAQPQLSVLLPTEMGPAPTTVKSIALSSWNPPPAYLRQKGHLLYLTVNTNEGKQYQITSHVGGFYVNNCSNAQFDPSPKTSQDGHAERSLYTLLEKLSPSFKESFENLQTFTNQKDPLATFQVGNTFPSAPWLVPSTSSSLLAHRADPTRTQETYLLAGAENTDSLRDWNEEFQSSKELPRDSIPDRVFRERLISKLFADYNDAAARGAVLVARGEVAPLNPTEDRDAQIFVYNNIFFSFGADGVGTFTSEGGDEAARVATGKDVFGVKMVNQFDIDGLYAPGTVVVDYLGKRIVGQSIVPGIFKQPEPGENQIHYGAVDGKEQVAADERFSAPFAKLAEALKVKKHSVWDKDQKRFDLEASVEMKGLLGTDGRKYVLDLYRITPLDIAWMEDGGEDSDYPHRMTVLRPELVESLGKVKTREYVNAELARRGLTKTTEEGANKEATEETKALESKPVESEKPKEAKKTEEETDEESEEESSEEESSEEEDSEDEETPKEKTKKVAEEKAEEKPEDKTEETTEETTEEKAEDKIDLADFKFALNPDVFSGQVPQTDEEKAEMAKDEQEVREACEYLRKTVMPGLIHDLKDGEISFPMDGRSLTKLLHRRGVNMRYLGQLVDLCEKEGSRLDCFRELCEREMITRSFKHVAAKYLKYLPLPLTSSCFAHLLNCFLGTGLNPKPAADVDQSLRELFSDADLSFEKVTPEGLREDIQKETSRRFRHTLKGEWWNKPRHIQLLREAALKLGLQIQARHFSFVPEKESPATNGQAPAEPKKKSKKKARDGSPASLASAGVPHTFVPDDFVNVVPLIKDSAPRSALADEAMEGGRISIYQGQRKLGEDLLLESLSLHEQIYGLLHPEVAQMYHTLSQLYYQLDQKDGAVELSRKATIVAERTLGVDSAETVLNYLNLSLFLHQRGDSQMALVYAKHAFNVWKLIYGVDHPDTITTMNNYAVMLQSIKAYHESRRWFEESLRVCELVYGRQTVNSATLLFQLSQALALDNESKEAVTRMRESFTIFRDLLGADDKNTKEAEHWLTQLTHNAVSIARQAKEQAKLGRGAFSLATRGVNMATAAGAAKELSGKAPSKQDQRPVEELVKFIEGSDNKGPKKRTGRANPKQRKSTPAK